MISKCKKWTRLLAQASTLQALTLPAKCFTIFSEMLLFISEKLPKLQQLHLGGVRTPISLRRLVETAASMKHLRLLGLPEGRHLGCNENHDPTEIEDSILWEQVYVWEDHPQRQFVGELRCEEAVARLIFEHCKRMQEIRWSGENPEIYEATFVVRKLMENIQKIVWWKCTDGGREVFEPYGDARSSYEAWVTRHPEQLENFLDLLGWW